MLNRVSILHMPAISAIYYALLQCGYEFFAVEKDESLTTTLEAFRTETAVFYDSYFSEIRQSTCDVYPYWPRAAALESACFFLDSMSSGFEHFDRYQEKIRSATNISPEEKGESFWRWIERFPAAINEVMKLASFQAYYAWETKWIAQQNALLQGALQQTQEALERCAGAFGSGIQSVDILLSPIKCAYSSDYHIVRDRLYFSSGMFQMESVVHEFLHPIMHPHIIGNRDALLQYRGDYPDLDASYLLDGSEAGRLNAAEEYLVRALTHCAVRGMLPNNLGYFIQQSMAALEHHYGMARAETNGKP